MGIPARWEWPALPPPSHSQLCRMSEFVFSSYWWWIDQLTTAGPSSPWMQALESAMQVGLVFSPGVFLTVPQQRALRSCR